MKNQTLYDKIESVLSYEKELLDNDLIIDIPMPTHISSSEKLELIVKNRDVIPDSSMDEIQNKASSKTIKNKKTNISSWQKSNSLDVLEYNINSCMNCVLGKTRKNFVFGTGNPKAKILIIGEAPGADEDEQGKPFVGRAGKLLTKVIEAIELKREDVYIANIIKCRPPDNRKPLDDEVEQCEPYLQKQIELIDPEFILALGLTAINTLLKKKHVMKESRGKLHEYHGRKLMVTYHPAALFRNPSWKKFVWKDVKNLRKMYDEYMEENK